MADVDYYRVLEIRRGASLNDIKQAYRRLARRFHPDLNADHGAGERFKQVREAYEVLADPERRAAYDRGAAARGGTTTRPSAGAAPKKKAHPPTRAHSQPSSANIHPQRVSGATLRSGRHSDPVTPSSPNPPQSSPNPNSRDQGAKVQGARVGGRRRARRPVGFFGRLFGSRRGYPVMLAPLSLTLQLEQAHAGGHFELELPATHARNGFSVIRVYVSPGTLAGTQIGCHVPGSEAEQFWVEVGYHDHPLFSPRGRDIYLDLPVAPWEAALGAVIAIPTLTGKVKLAVPEGSQSGRKLRLQGRGLGNVTTGGVGDLYARLLVVVPSAQSAQAKAFYERMREELPFHPRPHFF